MGRHLDLHDQDDAHGWRAACPGDLSVEEAAVLGGRYPGRLQGLLAGPGGGLLGKAAQLPIVSWALYKVRWKYRPVKMASDHYQRPYNAFSVE